MFIIMTEKNGDCDYKKSEEQSMQVAKDIYDIEEYYDWCMGAPAVKNAEGALAIML